MPNTSISISTGGTGLRFEGRLLALEKNLAMMPVASKLMMDELSAYTDRRWGEGEVVQETTLERWPDRMPLEITGTLRRSLTRSDAPGAIREITPVGFTWGTSIYYAKFLYYGTRKMEPKPVVQGMRQLRAVLGYQFRSWIIRGVYGASDNV